MDVLLLGLAKSKATRKAQRYFKERRVPLAYHDLRKRPPAPGELRRWLQALGIDRLVDTSARAYVEQGLSYLSASEDDWLQRLSADPSLLRLPLARCGGLLAVGDDVDAWGRLAAAARDG
jgi:arsenate reductase (glutaredoxin)